MDSLTHFPTGWKSPLVVTRSGVGVKKKRLQSTNRRTGEPDCDPSTVDDVDSFNKSIR